MRFVISINQSLLNFLLLLFVCAVHTGGAFSLSLLLGFESELHSLTATVNWKLTINGRHHNRRHNAHTIHSIGLLVFRLFVWRWCRFARAITSSIVRNCRWLLVYIAWNHILSRAVICCFTKIIEMPKNLLDSLSNWQYRYFVHTHTSKKNNNISHN